MINDIIDGILKVLFEYFGDGFKYYTESVEQGFKEPCFSIESISPSVTQKLNNRYLSENKFVINYFPNKKDSKKEINTISEQLFEVLEYIAVNGSVVRGTKMSTQISDGVLLFFVNYDLFRIKEKIVEPMEELESKERIKNE